MKILTIKTFLFGLLLLLTPTLAQAQQSNCVINFFHSQGCPHCEKQSQYLDLIETRYSRIRINRYEISSNPENAKLMEKFSQKLRAKRSGVPFTVINNDYLLGWHEQNTSGKLLDEIIYQQCGILIQLNDQDQPESRQAVNSTPEPSINNQNRNQSSSKKHRLNTYLEDIQIPLFGTIDLSGYSLPLITIFFGFLDGFNPCAMWVLLFLISILIGIPDKKRRWLLGAVFIVASGLIYFLFMTAWLNILLFLSFIFWIRFFIGLIALGGGGYNIFQFFRTKDKGCQVVDEEKRQKIFDKIKKISQENQLFLALGGLIVLAFSVNLIELICSAGLPAIYTQILSINQLPWYQYYLYLLLYIVFFILDDLIIFALAMITLKMTGISTKYGRLSHLVGGALMILIGLLLIFKPELLMFE
ncbi:MAG: hypothetical protein GF332_01850 [Candidatus Moranbacteria bacterium]|nr:hypothetical protein [Candidatus Moranbacteria bacterium]